MKRDNDYDIDEKIREYLNSEVKDINASENMFFKVKNEILRKNERGFLDMKIGFLKMKTALIAVGLCIATTASVGAATGKLSWSSSSSVLNDTNIYPTEDNVKGTVGFTPKYVESFDNGFKFKTFGFADNEIENEDGSTLKTKSADFMYTKDGNDKNKYLNMSATKIDEENFNPDGYKDKLEVTEYNGIKLYYQNFKYKSVPDGYEPTEEEKKQQESGDLQIGCGDKDTEIKVDNCQSVTWYEDGIGYDIFNSNYDEVTKDGMIDMAKAVINK